MSQARRRSCAHSSLRARADRRGHLHALARVDRRAQAEEQLFFVKAAHDRARQGLLEVPLLLDQRFYGLWPETGCPPALLAALLSGALFQLVREICGRTNLGDGALDASVDDARAMLIPEPRLLSPPMSARLQSLFLDLPAEEDGRAAGMPPGPRALRGPRRELDLALLELLGVPAAELPERLRGTDALIARRLSRARSSSGRTWRGTSARTERRCSGAVLEGLMNARSPIVLGLLLAGATACGDSAQQEAQSARALLSETLLDDFEGATAPAPWTFWNGSEFPGATGSLTVGPGHAGQGAHLVYDFTGGGDYVSAELTLATPTNAAAVTLWLRSPPGIRIRLRVTDSTDQTCQFAPTRPLFARDPSAWYRLSLPLDGEALCWGGAGDGVVHNPIQSLSILAGDPLEAGASGEIVFDDVALLDSLTFALDPATAERVPVAVEEARYADRFGVSIHFTQDDAALDAAAAAGFGWVRMDLRWDSVERQLGVYDFTEFDALVASLEERGLGAHFILAYWNFLYEDGPGYAPSSTEDVAAFAGFVEAAAAHFAGHKVRYEVWNEQNLSVFWKPAPDIAAYSALCAAAIAAVHEGDPTAKVSTGGLYGFDYGFLRGQLAAGAGAAADAAGVHPYRQTGPESASDDLLLMRSIVPESMPVWNTEWGYSSSWYGSGTAAETRHRQAVLAVRETLTSWALGLPVNIYYDVRDDGTDPANAEHNFGLLANDYSDKPAMTAMRTLGSIAGTRDLISQIVSPGSSALHILELASLTDRVYVLWSSSGTVEVGIPANATARDFLGGALSGTSLTVDEAAGPVYVTTPVPPTPDGGIVDAPGSGSDASPGELDALPPAGDGGEGIDGGTGSGDDGACGCRAAGRGGRPGGWLLLAAMAWLRRRRAGCAPSSR